MVDREEQLQSLAATRPGFIVNKNDFDNKIQHVETYLRFIIPYTTATMVSQVSVVTTFSSGIAVRMVPYLHKNQLIIT